MILGEYPCCDGPLCVPLSPLPLPAYERETCPHCGALVWHKHTRIDPTSWTDADFRAEFDVDDAAKRVTRRPA